MSQAPPAYSIPNDPIPRLGDRVDDSIFDKKPFGQDGCPDYAFKSRRLREKTVQAAAVSMLRIPAEGSGTAP